ncbi:hypothetical protein ACOMHN_021716 [Nucella lapillus]
MLFSSLSTPRPSRSMLGTPPNFFDISTSRTPAQTPMHMSVKTAVSEGLSSRKLIEAKLSDAGGFKEEFGWDPAYTEDAEDIGDEHRDRIYDLFNQGIALETQKKDVQELQEQDPTLECVRRCLTRPARPNAVAVYVKNDGLLYRRTGVCVTVLVFASLHWCLRRSTGVCVAVLLSASQHWCQRHSTADCVTLLLSASQHWCQRHSIAVCVTALMFASQHWCLRHSTGVGKINNRS